MTEDTQELTEELETEELQPEHKFYRHKHTMIYVARNTAKVTLFEWDDQEGETVFKVEIQSGGSTLTFVPDERDLDSLGAMFKGDCY